MVDAREFLDYVASHLVENGGYVGSAEIRFERLEEWLKEMEDKQDVTQMKKVILELDLPEAMKLVSVCNDAIMNTEEILDSLYSSYAKEMGKNSIKCIRTIRTKIKSAITERK